MIVVLIQVTNRNDLYSEKYVVTHQSRAEACQYCASSTSDYDITINRIVEVDLTRNVITELELQLNKVNKLQLVEKVRESEA